MIPAADMKTFPNVYLYENEVGKVNSWEYYFEQPAGIPVDEAFKSKNFIAIDSRVCPNPRQYMPFFMNQDGQLDYWRSICKKYIKFTPAVLDMLERAKINLRGKKVLGVSIRGTDYVSLKPHAHPVQPEVKDVIAKTLEVMNEKNFDSVYLATEDKNILEEFQKIFGEKLITPECEYIDFDYQDTRWVTTYVSERENDKYLRGLEYLVSKLLLLECRGLITSITSGSTGVMCLSSGFEYLYVFDLGYYE